MEPNKIEQLFKRYLQNECSPDEIKLLFQYFGSEENENVLKNLIQNELESSLDIEGTPSPEEKARMAKVFLKIKKDIHKAK